MSNLWGVSSVDRDEEGRSYAAQTVGRTGPKPATSRSGEVLGVVITCLLDMLIHDYRCILRHK